MTKIADVEGIGEAYAQKLAEAGIATTQALLEKAATPKGRKEVAAKTAIGDALILKWVNHVDLSRIKGIGSEYADLLEAAGVDTVVELAKRVPANLSKKMAEINLEKKLVRKLPAESRVTDWVAQAKKLPRIVKY